MSPEITRRRMLRASFLVGAAAAGCGRSQVRAASSFKVREIKVISHQPNLYNGWSTLARRRNGELLLAVSGGREAHVCPFGRVELMRSPDGGKTWAWPQVLIDGPTDDRDAGVLETSGGALLVTTFTSVAWEERVNPDGDWPEERVKRWQAVGLRCSKEERAGLLKQAMIRSTDGGLTWTTPYDSNVNSPHGPFQLSDGRVLYAGVTMSDTPHRVGVCESKNDGESWTWLADIPTRPGDQAEHYHELHGVEVSPGRIVVQIRNHNKANERETLQTESTDGGKTWSMPHSIGVWGLPSHLVRLRNGRLVMSYGHRRPPYGNQVRISDDGGRTWSESLILSGDGLGGDLGYPSTVELDDGTLVTVWYEKIAGSPYAVLRQATWTV